MKMPVIAVYDKKLAIYEKPFTVRLTGEAIREWDYVRKDKNTKIGMNPEDFDLFKIGDFNESTGLIEAHNPEHLATGV